MKIAQGTDQNERLKPACLWSGMRVRHDARSDAGPSPPLAGEGGAHMHMRIDRGGLGLGSRPYPRGTAMGTASVISVRYPHGIRAISSRTSPVRPYVSVQYGVCRGNGSVHPICLHFLCWLGLVSPLCSPHMPDVRTEPPPHRRENLEAVRAREGLTLPSLAGRATAVTGRASAPV